MDQNYFLTTIIPLLGLCFSFFVLVILIRRKFHFGLSLCIGAFILGFSSLARMSLFDFGNAISKAIFINFRTFEITFDTLELSVLMVLIFMLAQTMKDSGAIDKLIESLKSIFSHKVTIGIIPAIYGLMPVPGGALFSAPLVKTEGKKLGLTIDQGNFINVWFRHIWFPIFPISSAMILICSKDFTGLTYDIELYQIIWANMISFVSFVFIGIIILRRFIKKTIEKPNCKKRTYHGLKYLLVPTLPIIFYIIIYLFNQLFFFFQVQNYQNMIFIGGLIGSFILLFSFTKLSFKKYWSIVKNARSFHIAYAIIGILIFREMFEVTRINLLISDIINGLPVFPLLIILLIPCILGIITGYNLGAIALSYVIVQPFFALTSISIVGLTSLVFMSSFVGYLISPIHLCNVVSSDHFKTDTTRMYTLYIPSVITLLIIQTVFIYICYPV